MTKLHFFDRNEDYTVCERKLPHWIQPGVICFVTFRTYDSMPVAVVRQWSEERSAWLLRHGIDSKHPGWVHELRRLSPAIQTEFYRNFSARWHSELDRCHGAGVLRQRELAEIVSDSLLHGDEDKYHMTDFVIMPNHVHLLASFRDDQSLLKQCESWKHWTATQINRKLSQKGRFWQQDGFDHLVRSEHQFLNFRRYICDNPAKARLTEGQFIHYSKDL